MPSRQELEEINDQLQVQIKELEERLRNAPPPEVLEENEGLRAELESASKQLTEARRQADSLKESVRILQQRRQNELLEMQEARLRMEDLREIEVSRLGEEARRLASERLNMEDEARAKDSQVLQARREVAQAETKAGNYKKQMELAVRNMETSKSETAKARTEISRLEQVNNKALTQIAHLQELPDRPLWFDLLELLSSRPGWILLVMLILLTMWMVASVVGWMLS